MAPIVVEAAVDTLAAALGAEREGVDRIELCGPLEGGGTTPAAGLLEQCAAALRIPIHVLVRPREGDFVYATEEIAAMVAAIALAKPRGAAAVVTGALTPAGDIDVPAMRTLIAAAAPLPVGFHRAFDRLRDPFAGLERLVALGVRHVLTSGGAPTAIEGADRLRALVERAAGRVEILAGGSVTAANVVELLRRTGVRAVHGRAFQGVPQRVRGMSAA